MGEERAQLIGRDGDRGAVARCAAPLGDAGLWRYENDRGAVTMTAEGRAGGQKLLWYLSHNKLPMHFRNPPGYASIDANVMVLKGGQIGERRPGYVPDLDEQIEKGVVFCGNPDQVFEQLKRFYDHVGGFGHLLSMGQAGHMTHEETKKGIRLLAREVYPRLKELSPSNAGAASEKSEPVLHTVGVPQP